MEGRGLAASVLDEVAAGVRRRLEEGRSQPYLAAVLVGDDPGSATYVRMKRRDCERVGIASSDHHLPAQSHTQDVIQLVSELSRDQRVSGVLVQLPLPRQVDTAQVLEAVDPAKDVDGLHPFNAGRLLLGEPGLEPSTPAGIIGLLDHYAVAIGGRRATVVGRSNIVGKPVAVMLLRRDATVTVCHSKTADLAAACREADILVVAIGRPHAIRAAMVKPGAAVVDVGVNWIAGEQVGDVHPEVAEKAAYLSPSPGGVGPLTRAMLVRNTLLAEERRRP